VYGRKGRRSRRIAYLVVRVMSWGVVVADRKLGPEMNGTPWDLVGNGAKAGVKRGEMGGCGGDAWGGYKYVSGGP
jgi:hypothetical protein